MLTQSTSTALSVLALGTAVVHGAMVPAAGREGLGGLKLQGTHRSVDFRALASRAEPIPIADFQDITYRANVTIGGTPFGVQVDTGSADLWVLSNEDFKINKQTNVSVTVHYGTGQVTGPVTFSDIQLGSHAIKDQAFLNATKADNPVLQTGAVGIMGLSFDIFSGTDNAVRENFGALNTTGASVTSNLFGQAAQDQRFFDIYLERAWDPAEVKAMKTEGGLFIGEHADKYKDVVNASPLVRVEQDRGSWAVAAEHVTVRGKATSALSSSAKGLSPGQFTVLLDSGTTLAIIAPELVDAIYSSIPGAVRFNDSLTGGQYIVPCNAPVDASVSFRGHDFPVHPLDLTTIASRQVTVNGKNEDVTYCVNTYQYCITGLCGDGLDGILGDTFLKNVYASFNYGNDSRTLLFGNASFVQMLPITDPKAALEDFQSFRPAQLKSKSNVIDPARLVGILNGDSDKSSGTDGNNDSSKKTGENAVEGSLAGANDSQLTSLVEKYGPVIIGLLAGNLVVMCVLCIIGFVACTRGIIRGGARTRTVNPTYAPVRTKEEMLASDPADYRD